MCDLGYHRCPSCDDEMQCSLPNSDCDGLGMYESQPCGKCEWYISEQRKEDERYERMMHERDEWAKEYGQYGEGK